MKLCSTCEKHAIMKVPYKYQQTVKELSKNQNVKIMKKDKLRRMVIMNKSKYHEKCLMILENGNFKTLQHNLAKKTEEKNTMICKENQSQIIITRILTFISTFVPASFMG